MVLPLRFRRAISISIALFTTLFLSGVLPAMLGLKLDDNLMQSGVTVKFILGIFNGFLLWMIWKHRVP